MIFGTSLPHQLKTTTTTKKSLSKLYPPFTKLSVSAHGVTVCFVLCPLLSVPCRVDLRLRHLLVRLTCVFITAHLRCAKQNACMFRTFYMYAIRFTNPNINKLFTFARMSIFSHRLAYANAKKLQLSPLLLNMDKYRL